MERQTSLTRALIADGLKGGRVPFNFRQRVAIARLHLDAGALITCAERLEALAQEMRAEAAASREERAA